MYPNLTQLFSLHLGSNQLTTLPASLGNLTQLFSLHLSSNQLTALPEWLDNLTQLSQLDVQSNGLIELPLFLLNLTRLQNLLVQGNPLPALFPEIINSGEAQKILAYVSEAGPPLREAKLLILGEGGVGKTSLVKRLVDGVFNPQQSKTDGIDIRHWPVTTQPDKTVKLNIWDFGGQEIMHATHQFFLTQRSLYVVVLNAREGEEASKLHQWLGYVQTLGGEAPTIVVMNKIDDHPQLKLNERELQRKYPFIKGFIPTSCQTGYGIERLLELIQTVVGVLPHIENKMPLAWLGVKNHLEEMKGNYQADYINYRLYDELCEKQGIEENLRPALLQLLHDLGVVLNFYTKERDYSLQETHILNPAWVTQGVYSLINHPELDKANGVLRREQLPQLLDKKLYPSSVEHGFILQTMKSFELCFPFMEGEKYLLPSLLPKQEPLMAWGEEETLYFQIHYADFMPPSVFHRLMVRLNHLRKPNGALWFSGVELWFEECNALVRVDTEAKVMFIQVAGPTPERRVAFLAILRAELAYLHSTFKWANRPEEMVPIPGHPDIVEPYEYLRQLKEMGETVCIPRGLRERIPVEQLLYGVDGAIGDRIELRKMLYEASASEVREIIFDLEIPEAHLSGKNQAEQVMDLLGYVERRGMMERFKAVCEQKLKRR